MTRRTREILAALALGSLLGAGAMRTIDEAREGPPGPPSVLRCRPDTRGAPGDQVCVLP